MSEMVQIASTTLLIIDKVFCHFKFLVFLESGKVVIEVLFFSENLCNQIGNSLPSTVIWTPHQSPRGFVTKTKDPGSYAGYYQ